MDKFRSSGVVRFLRVLFSVCSGRIRAPGGGCARPVPQSLQQPLSAAAVRRCPRPSMATAATLARDPRPDLRPDGAESGVTPTAAGLHDAPDGASAMLRPHRRRVRVHAPCGESGGASLLQPPSAAPSPCSVAPAPSVRTPPRRPALLQPAQLCRVSLLPLAPEPALVAELLTAWLRRLARDGGRLRRHGEEARGSGARGAEEPDVAVSHR